MPALFLLQIFFTYKVTRNSLFRELGGKYAMLFLGNSYLRGLDILPMFIGKTLVHVYNLTKNWHIFLGYSGLSPLEK